MYLKIQNNNKTRASFFSLREGQIFLDPGKSTVIVCPDQDYNYYGALRYYNFSVTISKTPFIIDETPVLVTLPAPIITDPAIEGTSDEVETPKVESKIGETAQSEGTEVTEELPVEEVVEEVTEEVVEEVTEEVVEQATEEAAEEVVESGSAEAVESAQEESSEVVEDDSNDSDLVRKIKSLDKYQAKYVIRYLGLECTYRNEDKITSFLLESIGNFSEEKVLEAINSLN